MRSVAPRSTSYVTGLPVTDFLGSGYLDANGMVHFTPQTNYYGEGASFDYTVAGPNGQTGTATVRVSLEHVNQAPISCANEMWRRAA